jgi:hypothetical protein
MYNCDLEFLIIKRRRQVLKVGFYKSVNSLSFKGFSFYLARWALANRLKGFHEYLNDSNVTCGHVVRFIPET